MLLSSAISNLVPNVGGIIAFDESLPSDPTSAALLIAVFTLTILASVLVAGAKITHDHKFQPAQRCPFGGISEARTTSSRTSGKR